MRDPRDHPEGMHDPRNLVAVCEVHQESGFRGERTDKPARYCATIGFDGAIHDHGFGPPHWHDDFNGCIVSEQQSRDQIAWQASSVGSAALDAALAAKD